MCPMVVLDVIRLWLKCGAHTQEVRLAALSHLELVNATTSVCSLVAERHFVFENRSKSSVSAKLVNLFRSILSSLLDPSSTSVRRVSHYTSLVRILLLHWETWISFLIVWHAFLAILSIVLSSSARSWRINNLKDCFILRPLSWISFHSFVG